MQCYHCKAKAECIAAAQPGSIMCAINRMSYFLTARLSTMRKMLPA